MTAGGRRRAAQRDRPTEFAKRLQEFWTQMVRKSALTENITSRRRAMTQKRRKTGKGKRGRRGKKTNDDDDEGNDSDGLDAEMSIGVDDDILSSSSDGNGEEEEDNASSLLFDPKFWPFVLEWLTAISKSRYLSFRHTASFSGLLIMEGLIEIAVPKLDDLGVRSAQVRNERKNIERLLRISEQQSIAGIDSDEFEAL